MFRKRPRSKGWLLLALTLTFVFSGCKKDPPVQSELAYDIILVAGQSNTHQGFGYDPFLDAADERVMQLGRAAGHNMQVVAAQEPLEHWTALPDDIGFALTFAKEYAKKYLAENRNALIIPCGYSSTGFAAHQWNKGDPLYEDAVKRTRYALSLNGSNRLVAILWHQGENDIGWPYYQNALDSTIVAFRKDIAGNQDAIFIVGGMVPYWVAQSSSAMAQQSIIANTPKRIANTGYSNPYYPFEIHKENDTFTAIHYDAKGQRILGQRYFNVFDSLSRR